jgi:hypothetical protein
MMNQDGDHCVKVTFAPVSKEEMDVLLGEDERLNNLFNDKATLEYDGFERGMDDFIRFFYGADAAKMTALIIPELRNLPFSARAVLLKRHGSHGAKEETIKLK